MALVFKILSVAEWEAARRSGAFGGSPVDLRDGYIHLSTAAQVAETAAKHFAGRADLVVLAIEAASLGDALAWEPSRGGALFPHLYAPLAMDHVIWWEPLPLDREGKHAFPPLAH